MIEFAQKYIELGWRVFPIHGIDNGFCTCGRKNCTSPGKHPALVKSWKDEATTNHEQIENWFSGRGWLKIKPGFPRLF